MKLIAFKTYGQWGTRGVLKMVLNVNPRGMLLDEMRRRIKLMDRLDASDDVGIELDADEFKMVVGALNVFPFGVAHKDLLALIDDVLAAGQ